MNAAAAEMRFEEAAGLRNLRRTVREMEQKQKMAAVEGEDIDILACHAEPPLVAVNLFHLREWQDRRPARILLGGSRSLMPAEFFEALLNQFYLKSHTYRPDSHSRRLRRPRGTGGIAVGHSAAGKVEINTPTRNEEGYDCPRGDKCQA